jgi:hypothetical protein
MQHSLTLQREWLIEKLKNENKKILYLEYTIKGRFRNHAVFFAVNTVTKEIIFYDAKGWTLADYNLQNIYEIISKKYENYTFSQNINKEQYDIFNCIIYNIKRIQQLNDNVNTPFQTLLSNNPLSYKDIMKIRKDNAIKLLDVQFSQNKLVCTYYN